MVSGPTKLQSVVAADSVNVLGTRRRKRSGSDVSSDTSSGSDKRGAFDLVPSRDGKRIQVTSEREPGKLLASGLQQIKKFLEVRTRLAVMATGVFAGNT